MKSILTLFLLTFSLFVNAQTTEKIFIPNAFTPDGDGLNDIFRPIISGELNHYYLKIFDRNGSVVFTSTDPAIGWLGNSKSSDYLSTSEMFLYQVEVKWESGDFEKFNGTLFLLR